MAGALGWKFNRMVGVEARLAAPIVRQRSRVPYATGGVGGLRMLKTDEVANLGSSDQLPHRLRRRRAEVVCEQPLGRAVFSKGVTH